MKTLMTVYHLRRQLRLQSQELRRAQREAQAHQLQQMDDFAARAQAQHQAHVQQLAYDSERLISEAEGPPELLAALRKQLH
jgi:hypothetical protein